MNVSKSLPPAHAQSSGSNQNTVSAKVEDPSAAALFGDFRPERLGGRDKINLPPRTLQTLQRLQDQVVEKSQAAAAVFRQEPTPSDSVLREALMPVFDAQLALARAYHRIANRDALPLEQALQVHARLMDGFITLAETPCDPPLSADEAKLIQLFGAVALLFNGYAHFHGMSPRAGAHYPSIVFSDDLPYSAAATRFPHVGSTTFFSLGKNPLSGRVTTPLHESVHGGQQNHRRNSYLPTVSTDGQVRSGSLEASRHQKMVDESWATVAPIFQDCGVPVEVQARAMEQIAGELIAPYGQAFITRRPGMPAGHGVEKLTPLIAQAMRAAVVPGATSALVEREAQRAGWSPRAMLERPEDMAVIQHIQWHIQSLSAAMKSQAWTVAARDDFSRTMSALALRVDEAPGSQKLVAISSALSGFMVDLRLAHPAAIHIPRHAPVDEPTRHAAFLRAKHRRIEMLSELLFCIGRDAAHRPGRTIFPLSYRPDDQVRKALRKAKVDSGFIGKVERLRQAGGPVQEDEACDAIMMLAARLVGYPAHALVPDKLRPAVDIAPVDSPEWTFPRVEGLNAPPGDPHQATASTDLAATAERTHQKYSANFRTTTWLLTLPQYFFNADQSDKLQERLAKEAAKVAFVMASAIAHQDSGGNGHATRHALHAANLLGPYFFNGGANVLQALGLERLWPLLRHAPRDMGPQQAAGQVPPSPSVSSQEAVLYPTAADALFAAQPKAAQWDHGEKQGEFAPPPEPIRAFMKSDPGSAAVMLRTVVEDIHLLTLDLLWKLRDRAEQKHHASLGDDAARQAFEAQATQYYGLPYVRYYRAVAAA